MNLYYEVDYNYPCKNIKKSDRRKLKKSNNKINFIKLMFAQDRRSYDNEFKMMELSASNHLGGIKYMFNIGQKIYALRIINASGNMHVRRFFEMKEEESVVRKL